MLSVIVPTYNEHDNMRPLLERVLPVFEGLGEEAELLILDDASPDDTAGEARRVAESLGASDQVRVIVRPDDRGLSKAVTQGFREAKGDVVAVMDADLSHPPEVLADLLAPIRADEADLAVASRRVPGGGVENWPLVRRFTSWSASLLALPLVSVKDTTSGFFAVRRTLLEGVELKPIGYKIGLEVLVRTGAQRVAEVPFVFTDRTHGQSKLGGKVIVAYLAQLAELYRVRFPRLSGYVQYALVGSVGAVLSGLLFFVLQGLAGLGDAPSHAAAIAAAVYFNFRLNRAWTFKERQGGAHLGIYAAICAVGYLLRRGVLAVLPATGADVPHPGTVCEHGLSGWLVLLAALGIASVWNYAASRRWAFPEGPAAQAEAGEARARSTVVWLVLGIAVFHIFFSGWIDLAADEAYYWQWSRGAHLAVGYFDHPPMVAWLIAFGTHIVGVHETGVRLMTSLLLAGLVALVWWMACVWSEARGEGERRLRAGLWAAGALLAAPLFSVNGILATPDAPLLFLWTATLALTIQALRTGRFVWWLLTGLALGLGMLSKYHMGLLPPAILAALLMSAPGRRALKRPGPYVAVGLGVLITLPFLRWLIDHDFAGLAFQLEHGTDRGEERTLLDALDSLGEYFGGQIAFLTPFLCAFVVWFLALSTRGLVRRLRGRETAGSDLDAAMLPLLVVPAVLVLLFFAYASLKASPELNWPSVAYPSAFVLAGPLLARWHARGGHPRFRAWFAVGLAAVVSAYAHVELARPLFVRGGFFSKIEPRRPLASIVDAHRTVRDDGLADPPVLCDSYRTASLLAFYMRDRPYTGAPFEYGSGEQYAYWEDEVPLRPGAYAWYITRSKPDVRVAMLFREHRLAWEYPATRLGKVTRTYYGYYGPLRGDPIAREPILPGK